MAESSGRVLMIVRGDSRFQDLMIEEEVFVMRDIVESAGYAVDVITVDDHPLVGEVSLHPDLTVDDVEVSDYDGVLLPCMAPEMDPSTVMPDSIHALVAEAARRGIPLGAMRASVRELARVGALDNRRYSYISDLDLPGSQFFGSGVTRDGDVVTASSCPALAKYSGGANETRELAETFVEMLAAKTGE